MNNKITNLDLEVVPYDPLENKKWGFSTFSEKINGRLAMLAFTFLLIYEFLTKQKITEQLFIHLDK